MQKKDKKVTFAKLYTVIVIFLTLHIVIIDKVVLLLNSFDCKSENVGDTF